MLRSVLLGTGVLACSAVGAMAQSGQATAFAGGFVVTAVSGTACDDAGIQVRELYTLVFRPRIGASGPAVLQVLQNRRATRIENGANRNFTASGTYLATAFSGRGGLQSYQGTYDSFVVDPPAPTATTEFVTITGRIANYNNVDCAVTFRASAARSP